MKIKLYLQNIHIYLHEEHILRLQDDKIVIFDERSH